MSGCRLQRMSYSGFVVFALLHVPARSACEFLTPVAAVDLSFPRRSEVIFGHAGL